LLPISGSPEPELAVMNNPAQPERSRNRKRQEADELHVHAIGLSRAVASLLIA
jgi:hypothetical protein